MAHLSRLSASALALFLSSPAFAQQDRSAEKETTFTFSANYDHTTGSYGTGTNLPSSTLSVGLLLDINQNWTLDLDLPYLRQTAPVVSRGQTTRVVRIGGKLVPIKGLGPVSKLEQVTGQGDATVALTRNFDFGSGPVWSAGAKIKLATARADSGLGTGKNDLSIQGGVINDFDPLTVTATAGLTVVGRVAGSELRNTGYIDLDGSYKVTEHWSIGASLSAAQSPVPGSPAPLSIATSANYKFRPGSYVTMGLVRGLSDGSPSWGVNLGVNFGF